MTIDRDIFTKRGITPRVRDRRPYAWYDKGDLEAVLAADPSYRMLPRKQFHGWLKRVVNQSSGHVMVRRSPPLSMFADVPSFDPFAELRPSKPVVARWEPHLHSNIGDPVAAADHALEEHRVITWKELYALGDKEWIGPIEDGGIGDGFVLGNPDDEHSHIDGAKYVFPPSASRWVPTGLPAPAPSLVYKKDRAQARARRLDMHRDAVTLLGDAPRVWVVLEGVLKADALLSVGECAVSVPSISLWDTEELRSFAEEHLLRVPVFVLVDSDWSDWGKNEGAVLKQAIACREMLRSIGVKAEVAAPPTIAGDAKTGVDDLIGAGRSVGEIEIIHREVPDLTEAVAHHPRSQELRERDEAILGWLSLYADIRSGRSGQAFSPASTIARATGMTTRRVQRTLVHLREFRMIRQLEPVHEVFDVHAGWRDQRVSDHQYGTWRTVPPLDRIVNLEWIAKITVTRVKC